MKQDLLDILAFGAHPDDVEIGAGATLAKAIANGKKVGILDFTRGEMGTRGSANIRDKEASLAGQLLGLSARHNLELADCFFENNIENQLKIIVFIRHYRPKIVLLNPTTDRHPDHGKACFLGSTACFLSGLPKIQTSFYNKPQEAFRPSFVYKYIQWNTQTPDFVVDVTGFMTKKMEVIQAYASQFYQKNSAEPQTVIATKNFLKSIDYRARDLGRLVGVKHAEGFTSERYIAIDSFDNLK